MLFLATMINMKVKTFLLKFLLLLIVLFSSCSSYKKIESNGPISIKCKVIRIIPHEHFFEIDIKQGKNKYKVLSKRSDVIGDNIIKIDETYTFHLSPLYYYNRPPSIIVNNDTVLVAPNAGIYNNTFYIDYCNETIEIKEQIQIYEADNLNGLCLDDSR